MPRVSAAFFSAGVIFALIGMAWGSYMGAREDFALAPAHAHLNLVGWVTMALYGTFYALTRGTLLTPLAWTNFAISFLGTILQVSGLALFLSNGPKFMPVMVGGEMLTILGMLVFAVSVFRELVRRRHKY